MNLLHIYAQEAWHDDAFIVGNRLGLEVLREAISQALEKGRVSTYDVTGGSSVYTTDGEGYAVKIICEDSGWQEESWCSLSLPYTDELAKDDRPNREVPYDIWLRG